MIDWNQTKLLHLSILLPHQLPHTSDISTFKLFFPYPSTISFSQIRHPLRNARCNFCVVGSSVNQPFSWFLENEGKLKVDKKETLKKRRYTQVIIFIFLAPLHIFPYFVTFCIFCISVGIKTRKWGSMVGNFLTTLSRFFFFQNFLFWFVWWAPWSS